MADHLVVIEDQYQIATRHTCFRLLAAVEEIVDDHLAAFVAC
ncbi:MAG: hypothetical protein ACXVKL_00300 [Candidatus Angelobacter sp.]